MRNKHEMGISTPKKRAFQDMFKQIRSTQLAKKSRLMPHRPEEIPSEQKKMIFKETHAIKVQTRHPREAVGQSTLRQRILYFKIMPTLDRL